MAALLATLACSSGSPSGPAAASSSAAAGYCPFCESCSGPNLPRVPPPPTIDATAPESCIGSVYRYRCTEIGSTSRVGGGQIELDGTRLEEQQGEFSGELFSRTTGTLRNSRSRFCRATLLDHEAAPNSPWFLKEILCVRLPGDRGPQRGFSAEVRLLPGSEDIELGLHLDPASTSVTGSKGRVTNMPTLATSSTSHTVEFDILGISRRFELQREKPSASPEAPLLYRFREERKVTEPYPFMGPGGVATGTELLVVQLACKSLVI